MFKKYILPLFLSFLITFSAAFIGSAFTSKSIANWYQFLNKPSFAPPNWLFAPVWTILFLMMAIAVFLVWQKRKAIPIKTALILYLVQLILNAFWSVIFFGFRNPALAFFEIIVLWLLILFTLMNFYKINKIAGFLFLPYLLWVSFATILNLSIWLLNEATR